MQVFKSEVAVKYNAVLGEGPCWDEKRKLLFWIDSVGNKVCISDLKTGATTIFDVGQNVGTLVLTEDDDVVVLGLVDGLYTLNIKTGELLLKCNPEEGIEGNRLNDGKADITGRIWIGSMCVADNGKEGYDTACKCNLHKVNQDFSYELVDPEVRLSNGMVWTQDQKTMYYVDSPTRYVYQYDFDVEKGTISNRRVCVEIDPELGVGDGMDIDEDGNLWIAHYTGWCVGKWDPRTGKMLAKVNVPVSRVTSCAFGGENQDELYITTASMNAEQDDVAQPDAGCVFVAKNLGTKGYPFWRFKG